MVVEVAAALATLLYSLLAIVIGFLIKQISSKLAVNRKAARRKTAQPTLKLLPVGRYNTAMRVTLSDSAYHALVEQSGFYNINSYEADRTLGEHVT